MYSISSYSITINTLLILSLHITNHYVVKLRFFFFFFYHILSYLQNVGESPQYFAEWLHHSSSRVWSVEPSEHLHHVMEQRHLSSLVFIRDFKMHQTQFFFQTLISLLDVEHVFIIYVLHYSITNVASIILHFIVPVTLIFCYVAKNFHYTLKTLLSLPNIPRNKIEYFTLTRFILISAFELW